MNEVLNVRYSEIVASLNQRFDQELDLQGILFLIAFKSLEKVIYL